MACPRFLNQYPRSVGRGRLTDVPWTLDAGGDRLRALSLVMAPGSFETGTNGGRHGNRYGTNMTARLIPQEPIYVNFSERLFAEKLREQLPDDAVMFVNQRFTGPAGDVEADVIVAWPGFGMMVIEVKGGSVFLQDQQWRQVWQHGSTTKRIDPVAQARNAKYKLRDYLDDHVRWSNGRPRLAHMVALTATTLDAAFNAPDAPRWMIVDRTEMDHAASRVADVLKQGTDQAKPPSHGDVELLVECLAGVLIPQRDLLADLDERESTCEILSKDQARVLDMMGSHSRVEIRGGAGSGKTWLAVEKARRLAASGQRVALICYSRGLAAFLSRRVDTLKSGQRPAYAGTFHALGMGWGAPPRSDDDSAYWEDELPKLMLSLATDLPLSERFDAIVVDEAQDFAETWWPAVLACLRDPDGGGLYVFSDENQRVFARQGGPTMPLVAIDLTENLRNTKQIAGTFSSLAPAVMKVRGGTGAPVRFVQCEPAEAVDFADDAIELLMKQGWPAESLALLTTNGRHPYQVEQQAEGQDAYWHSFWEDEYPFYDHVLGFKGLERPAVVLAINGFRDEERAREMLYVGLSRARDLLVVCGDMDMIKRVGGDGVVNQLIKPGAGVGLS